MRQFDFDGPTFGKCGNCGEPLEQPGYGLETCSCEYSYETTLSGHIIIYDPFGDIVPEPVLL